MPETLTRQQTKKISRPLTAANDSAVVEIHAYLAARNLFLREVEENPTESNLRRAAAANDFAEICLRPARAPYEAQALSEKEAARERQLCRAIKMRLAELRARLGRRCSA